MLDLGFLGKWEDLSHYTLKDHSLCYIREWTKEDFGKIEQYIDSLSPEDIRSRFLAPISKDALKDPNRLEKIYNKSIGAQHFVFVALHNNEICGVSHCWAEEGNTFEVSFSRRSDYKGLGVGRALIEHVVRWAKQNNFQLHGITLYDNEPMKKLFEVNGFQKVRSEEPGTNRYVFIS